MTICNSLYLSGGSRGRPRGVRTLIRPEGCFLLGSIKMHFSEPEISHYFWGSLPNTPNWREAVITRALYLQKYSFYFTFSGKPWDPPYQKFLDTTPYLVTVMEASLLGRQQSEIKLKCLYGNAR